MSDRLYFTDPHHAVVVNENGDKQNVCIAPAEDGKTVPPGRELVYVDHTKPNHDGSFTILARHKSGPAQVASKAYRDNYDAIFGDKALN